MIGFIVDCFVEFRITRLAWIWQLNFHSNRLWFPALAQKPAAWWMFPKTSLAPPSTWSCPDFQHRPHPQGSISAERRENDAFYHPGVYRNDPTRPPVAMSPEPPPRFQPMLRVYHEGIRHAEGFASGSELIGWTWRGLCY